MADNPKDTLIWLCNIHIYLPLTMRMFDIPKTYFKPNDEAKLRRLHAAGTKKLSPISSPASLDLFHFATHFKLWKSMKDSQICPYIILCQTCAEAGKELN